MDEVMQEVEEVKSRAKVESAKKAPRKKVVKKVIVDLDMTQEDVVKYAGEGHQLFFADGDDFLELDEEVVASLDSQTKQRYHVAKAIAFGEDVLGAATNAILGYDADAFNVRPGAASENTKVFGKDPRREYYWGRPDKHNKHLADGWEVDRDPNVKTRFEESGTQKTLGGQNKRESTLYSRPKEYGKELRAKRKAIRESRLLKTQNATKEAAIRAGVKVIE